MPLAKPLARRIDRLARAAHAFHRYAHHPLCDEYRSEVVQLGRRTRVCRGCLLVASGTVAGLVAGAFLARGAVALIVIGLLALIIARVTPGGRPSKWISRLVPAAALGAAAVGGLIGGSIVGLCVSALAILLYVGVAVGYRQRGPDRTPCRTCPERLLATPCRGVRPIVRRERAFQRVAGRMIESAGQ